MSLHILREVISDPARLSDGYQLYDGFISGPSVILRMSLMQSSFAILRLPADLVTPG